MCKPPVVKSLLWMLAGVCWMCGATFAAEMKGHQPAGDDDPHAHHRAMMAKPADEGRSADVKLLDLELVDQDGKPLRFKTEVIGDRIVVMDFVYTTCTTVCPVLSAVFGQIQNRLGERLGREVFLVSVSVDPARDSPPRLKAYSRRHHARPGWIWLTGRKPVLDQVLTGMGAYAPDFTEHPSLVLVGDGRSGDWTRFYGFPSPDQVLTRVDELLAARQDTVSAVANVE